MHELEGHDLDGCTARSVDDDGFESNFQVQDACTSLKDRLLEALETNFGLGSSCS